MKSVFMLFPAGEGSCPRCGAADRGTEKCGNCGWRMTSAYVETDPDEIAALDALAKED